MTNEFVTSNNNHGQTKKSGAFNLCWEDSKKIFNNTWNQETKPVEMYRTDFITAMKIPDQQVLDDHFIKIADAWKQEYDKGVQVPVDIVSLPKPDFKLLESSDEEKLWTLPESYYKWQPEADVIDEVMNGKVPEPLYDMDEDDISFLASINSVEDSKDNITEIDFEVIFTYLDTLCHVNMFTKYQENLTYSIQYDDSVYCEVCKDIYSEPDNEMIFCDNCNICVHQSCYGVPKIPKGEWYCAPCKADCSTPVCLLCMQGEGAFKLAQQGEWVHIFCALWIPEVGFGNIEKMEPITKIKQIPTNRWSLSCCFCQERVGACIQCSMKGCFVPFHASCAYSNRSHMMTTYGTPEEPEIVENFAYCMKHSSEKFREPSSINSIVLPLCRKDKLNPLYSNQTKIARTLLSEFYDYVDVLDVSTALDFNVSIIQFAFDYWKEKRKLNGNNPLISLPPLSELVEKATKLNNNAENSELDPFLKLVSLRQDLERARVLVHMSERRERLKKRVLNSVFSVIECCFKEGKQLPASLLKFSLSPASFARNSNSNSYSTASSGEDSDLNISQSSISKVFLSPVNQKPIDVYSFKDDENSLVAHEVILKDEDVSDQSDSKKIPFDYHSSEDPEWIEAPRKAKKKKAGPLSKINKMKQLAAHFSRKITIEFSDKSDVQSSVDDSCHFSTPPTSPEFTSPHVFSFPQQESESSQTTTKRRRTSCDLSDDDRDDKFVLANTPPSAPKNNKENVRSLNTSKDEDDSRGGGTSPVRSSRSSKRHKPNQKYDAYDCS